MGQNNTWIKPRHQVITTLLRPFLRVYCQLKYGVTFEPFRAEGKRPYLIVMNHQTGFDQFFVGVTFRQPVYYLATEDIFSLGWVSNLLRWLVAPIPIQKQTTDIQAVKNCIRVAREGGSICLAPEGNRTFHGQTVYMNPSIASLAKKLQLPIAFFRIEGGYGVQPRWSDVVRKGKMRCRISRVLEPEDYEDLSKDDLYRVIEGELAQDENCLSGSFHHKKNAEFLERAMYVCPWCGLSTFESHDDIIHCTKCGRKIRHLSTKELQGIDCDFPHRFVADWYHWQNDYINNTDLTALTREPVYRETARLSRVHAAKFKELLKKEATVCLYGDRITVDDREFPFSQVGAVVVLGKNKLNIYNGKEILQLKGTQRFNALKYVNFFHRYKNATTGDQNGKFLGV
jgi:1-acyl-sn-glycerol-3-phosphate acyltransferase